MPSRTTDADDTIFALSSGRPPAAIAVVRVSGPRAGEALGALVGKLPAPRYASLRAIRDTTGALLDRGLVLWFPGQDTATGEPLAELHLHGGVAVVNAVLSALAAHGLRLAGPGEFTRRAVMNGRLTFADAEGLADLLVAETETQRREAMRRTDGGIGTLIGGWCDRLLEIAARLEAAIDYDGEVAHDENQIRTDLQTLIAAMNQQLALPSAEKLRDGVRVAIVGPANAGKSSLFNRLVGSETAIVSDRPGTTRDVMEKAVAIEGIPFVFFDTAGHRDSDDPIEIEGHRRARHVEQVADVVIDLNDEASAGATRIPVLSKCDQGAAAADRLNVSAFTGVGLSSLRAMLIKHAMALLPGDTDLVFTDRVNRIVTDAVAELSAMDGIEDSSLIAEHVTQARRWLASVVGGTAPNEVLDALFGRFCLGK